MAKPPKDLGPVAFVVAADPDKKIVIFQFNKALNRLELGPDEAMEIASNLMSRAAIASGMSVQEMVSARIRKNAADGNNKIAALPSESGSEMGFFDDKGTKQ